MDTSKLPVVNISNTVPLLYALPSLNQSRLGGIMPTFNHVRLFVVVVVCGVMMARRWRRRRPCVRARDALRGGVAASLST